MDGARIQGGILIVHARKLIDQDEDRQKVAILFKVGRKTLYRALAVS
jgi:DNA-binding phage protein